MFAFARDVSKNDNPPITWETVIWLLLISAMLEFTAGFTFFIH